MTVLALLGVAFLSALIPVVNLEVYLGGVAAVVEDISVAGVVWLSLVAAVGQMFGKLLFFYAGRGDIRLPARMRRHTAPKPGRRWARAQEQLARWRVRVQERPVMAAALVFLSASVGIPPFALVAVAAGTMRVPTLVFLLTGTLGRWLRFGLVLGGVELLIGS
ncbi:MAG: hypothetical protein H0T85_06995 [Geodermatophilaceae bacterium]|nr:hypothetical protein [Geodermatophilaceae bacterium]